jgi:hypothetical protein
MSITTDLVAHITALIAADTTLTAKLNSKWLFYGLPQAFPSIYIDGLYVVDDKLDTHTFNLHFVTADLGIEQLDTAKQVLAAIQASGCIQAQGLLPRPEPENKRNRWMIPCRFFPAYL